MKTESIIPFIYLAFFVFLIYSIVNFFKNKEKIAKALVDGGKEVVKATAKKINKDIEKLDDKAKTGGIVSGSIKTGAIGAGTGAATGAVVGAGMLAVGSTAAAGIGTTALAASGVGLVAGAVVGGSIAAAKNCIYCPTSHPKKEGAICYKGTCETEYGSSYIKSGLGCAKKCKKGYTDMGLTCYDPPSWKYPLGRSYKNGWKPRSTHAVICKKK